tara:strand:- start:4024 stop:4896 length:873 start_codon:yes stop_codon:yes gene_type:complete
MPPDRIPEPKNLKEVTFLDSTIETIDYALHDYVNEQFDVSAQTNKGWKKVPIIWLTAERSYQIKNNKDLRDDYEYFKYPLMSIQRDSVTKDPAFKGSAYAHIFPTKLFAGDPKGGTIPVARRIVQDKTQNFQDAKAKKRFGKYNWPKPAKQRTVVETMYIPIPVYVTVMYTITIKSEYQQQINEMVQPFMTRTGQINNFIIERDGHKYEAFIESDFAQNFNTPSLAQDERVFETSIKIRVLGHLIGDGKNQNRPKIVSRENAVVVKIPREHVIFGDERPWAKYDKKYTKE